MLVMLAGSAGYACWLQKMAKLAGLQSRLTVLDMPASWLEWLAGWLAVISKQTGWLSRIRWLAVYADHDESLARAAILHGWICSLHGLFVYAGYAGWLC
jgi:NADH:ubiquinone oxidoreductase subunit 5 (subunit L)/multisubunit Na+/H+ antiporter MnhA subunit